ncbi:MAG TPA: crossover junction endodeoxyribonuclease RuvC [Rhodopila sp.]|uniref:crossover junction endodeoxyribonuclease RuvC n=1 Tax=Rhodopila sp. TaxID=2480087 RepID=UPI002D1DC0A7|nr:crossover junction endodeoxyribonuclease RuvC [Rhodopila sp.]HVY14724.1 crossover junction endodeoxyribonuclease RuvC [Rhodopila sp.]
MTRVLGIDPGLRFTGWGIIEAEGPSLRYVASGVIATDGEDRLPLRLKRLHDGLSDLLARYQPAEAAVEETYFNSNGTTSLKLGYARAIALLAPAMADIPVSEYPAKTVKKAISGSGSADKRQVGLMVTRLMPAAVTNRADAADALAVAICHAYHRTSLLAWNKALAS